MIEYELEKSKIEIKENNKPTNIYKDIYEIDIVFSKNQNINYIAYVYLDDVLQQQKKLENGKNTIEINSLTEGMHKIKIEIKNKEVIISSLEKNISYIKEYEEQFLDEFNGNGVVWHILNLSLEEFEKSVLLQKNMGIKRIRIEIKSSEIININGDIDFKKYNEKMKILEAYEMEPIVILDTNMGTNRKVTSDNELQEYKIYVQEIANKYKFIKYFEICNEPNYYYKTDEEIKAYTNVVKETKNILKDKVILAGSTLQYNSDAWKEEDRYDYDIFLKKITEHGVYSQANAYSYHFYTLKPDNTEYTNYVKKQNEFNNSIGGFLKFYITETGLPSIERIGEKKQAETLIQQANIIKYGKIQESIIYNFRNVGNDIHNYEKNYGIVENDYTPKPAYYSLKNYYENTNGSEYIGTINLEKGLETHVYDKDGKPKIITWSNNSEKNITIPYENFTAKDIYGNEIKNENGELTITTSPIYLDNIEEKYFYQAISNTATTKYTEFEEKFAEEIEKLPEIKQQTKNLKQQIEQIGKTETRIDEQTAKTLMQRHFQLGNSLINAYQNRRIETEKVKLSSMLDMLNDIGNSYEDLVTVTAKTRNADISQAKDLVKEVENIITSNSDIEIVYPAKILEFSKDYQEKAEYINGLEEENDIKTGLIVSKNLHSIYLSNWAKEFTNIYIDEYLKNNLIAENYSEKNITNQDVTVTLNIGDDTKITNNNGSNQYIFKEKGEYTFEYERRGRNFRQTVKVENIDKQSPKITGVEEGQVYENKIKPIIEDENLETVRLIQDGRVIDNYINNAEIKEEGMYRIEAIDKAGNKTITSFEIIENISKEYIIENNIIKNIEANTTVEQFKENIKIQTEYNIQREGQTLEAKEKIATGDILQIGDTQYTLIVRGDIDKDSKITIKDLILLRQQIIGEKTLEDTAKTAGDIDLNKKIDARDIVKLRKLILTNNQ